MRRGMSLPMLMAVEKLTTKNYFQTATARRRGEAVTLIRNTEALRDVAKKSRADIEAIEIEWRAAKRK